MTTPAIIESHFPHRPHADARALQALSPVWREAYHARQAQLTDSAERSRYQPPLLAKLRAFERRFVAAGGLLAAGPDPGRHVLSGFGDQRNFELLLESGFSVPQAVGILTANGAQILGDQDLYGRIALGLRADLVVLDGDLLQDLTRYAVERFLYRLSRTSHGDRFVLKGALLMLASLGDTLSLTKSYGCPDFRLVSAECNRNQRARMVLPYRASLLSTVSRISGSTKD